MKLTDSQEKELRALFARGLRGGPGWDRKYSMCVEQAVSLVTDGEFTDNPSCVAHQDRLFVTEVNDLPWSSREVRSEVLWTLALAQLGTRGKDRKAWTEKVAMALVNTILPLALEAAGLPGHAIECRQATTPQEAKEAVDCAHKVSKKAAQEEHKAIDFDALVPRNPENKVIFAQILKQRIMGHASTATLRMSVGFDEPTNLRLALLVNAVTEVSLCLDARDNELGKVNTKKETGDKLFKQVVEIGLAAYRSEEA